MDTWIHRTVLFATISWVQSVGLEPPRFLTKGKDFQTVAGDSVVLPCLVDNLGSHVLMWRKDSHILAAARMLVVRDSRFSILPEYDLKIINITTKDGGDYTCQIADVTTQDLVHKIIVLAPPVVYSSVANGQVTARKGGSVTLECSATGNPTPTVLWSKKDSGHSYNPGVTVTLDRVDRHHAGVYQCTARNGVGPPVSVDVRLDILHPPEIEVEHGWVNTEEGDRVSLVCIVHGNPTPNLMWYHEGSLALARRFSTDTQDNRHSLSIYPVTRSDFGNFSCVAENPLGRSKHTIQLSGKPGKILVSSSPYSASTTCYTLVWRTDSVSILEESRVIYRQIMINDSHKIIGAWREKSFRLPSSSGRSSISNIISNLEPSSVYQARVQVRNRYGWNDLSDPFQFYTRGYNHDTSENSLDHLQSSSPCLYGQPYHLLVFGIWHLAKMKT